MSGRLEDQYKAMKDFEEILEDARMAADSDVEEKFVSETKVKYDKWGGTMFWSEKQDRWLRVIAGADDY